MNDDKLKRGNELKAFIDKVEKELADYAKCKTLQKPYYPWLDVCLRNTNGGVVISSPSESANRMIITLYLADLKEQLEQAKNEYAKL